MRWTENPENVVQLHEAPQIIKLYYMKNRYIAAFFALMFPALAINEFYCGNYRTGLIEVLISVLLCWTGFAPLIIVLINIIRMCQYLWCSSNEEFMGKYCTVTTIVNE